MYMWTFYLFHYPWQSSGEHTCTYITFGWTLIPFCDVHTCSMYIHVVMLPYRYRKFSSLLVLLKEFPVHNSCQPNVVAWSRTLSLLFLWCSLHTVWCLKVSGGLKWRTKEVEPKSIFSVRIDNLESTDSLHRGRRGGQHMALLHICWANYYSSSWITSLCCLPTQ